jgi:tripartite-type tricarboxylate transporter receptor subunit TctC
MKFDSLLSFAAQLGALTAIGLLASGTGIAASSTQRIVADYPYKPIRIVDGSVAGNLNDYLARVIGQKLTERFGQPVIIENHPGAAGNIGANIAAKAAPDGYTMFIALSSWMASSVSLFPNLNYNLMKDFAFVTLVGSGNFVLVVGPAVPAKSVQELMALARSKPDQVRYGSAGVGSPLHLGMELLNMMAGVRMAHVPYKSSALMTPALVADEVQAGFSGFGTAMPLVKAGRLSALAVTSARRAVAYPELPTIAESGFPGFDVTPWYGLIAPAAAPPAIIKGLNSEIIKILQLPEVKASFASQGVEAIGSTPERFKELMQAEVEVWAKVIKTANIRVE